jgi:hypothetical protein
MQSTLFAVISLYNSILKLGPQGVTLLLFKVNYPLSLKKKKKTCKLSFTAVFTLLPIHYDPLQLDRLILIDLLI